MLEDAGWVDRDGDGIREDADGNPLTLIHGTTIREIRQDNQAVTQQMLREVGIDLQILSFDADSFSELCRRLTGCIGRCGHHGVVGLDRLPRPGPILLALLRAAR